MTSAYLLPALVLLPVAAGPAAWALRRRSAAWGDSFALGIVGIEIIFSIILLNGENSWLVPDVLGLGLSLEGGGFRSVIALLCTLCWGVSTVFSREYLRHDGAAARFQLFWLPTLGATLGVFLAGDLFTLFVCFELMSFTSYVLVLHTQAPDARKGSDTYLAVAVVCGMIALPGLFLLQAELGTLSISALAEAAAGKSAAALLPAGLLLLVGFAAKAGTVPLHVWLPMAHPAAPAPASAVLSGIITKTGVFGLAVLTVQLFPQSPFWGNLLLGLGLANMLLGAVLALLGTDLKYIFACSSVSQIGFVLTGLGMQVLLGSHNALAVSGTVLHICNHALIKLVLFNMAGAIQHDAHTLDLNALRGWGRGKPLAAALMAVPMLSIAGVPGFSGYVSKTLLHEGLVEHIHALEAAGASALAYQAGEWVFLFSGGLTAAYMLKVFLCLFTGPAPEPRKTKKGYLSAPSAWAFALVCAVLVLGGMFPNALMEPLANFCYGFFHGHDPHAVGYFVWVNLKGACISLAVGGCVFLLAAGGLLRSRRTGLWRNGRPAWLDLEGRVYRPLLLRILPDVGALAARCLDLLAVFPMAVGAKLLYWRQTSDFLPPEDAQFAAYRRLGRSTRSVSHTFTYSLAFMTGGLLYITLWLLFRYLAIR